MSDRDDETPKRLLPKVGGGYPVITASGIPRPHTAATGPRQQVELTLTLTVSAEAEAAGREVVRVIAAACAQPTTPKAVERVATLRFLFPEIAVKVHEFYGFMNELVAAGRLDDIHRIMREPGGRGRPRKSLFLVALVEQVIAENPGWTAQKAAQHIFAFVERGEGLPYIPSEARMRNVYSEYRTWYALWSQSLFVPAEILTAGYWREPGDEPSAEEAARAATLLRELIERYRTEEIGVDGPYKFDALYRRFAMSDGRTPLVSAQDPEFGPYTRYQLTQVDNVISRMHAGWRLVSWPELEEAHRRCGLGDDAEPRALEDDNRSNDDGETQQ